MVRLRELGYLDDAAFVEALVAYRAHSRGPALIAAELTSKGIAPDLARRAVARLDRDQLVAAARRRAGPGAATDPRRAAVRLLRLGYARDVVRAALAVDADEWEPET